MPSSDFRGRRLPHWQSPGATYFVTFHLADSLPQTVLETIEFEQRELLRTERQQKRALTSIERERSEELWSDRIEEYLDAGSGACCLAKPEIASLVANALRHFDNKRYTLDAWCVMPNHLHALFALFPSERLEAVLHSWKSFTSKEADKLLNRHGPFWQRDYFNRLVRDEQEAEAYRIYIQQNPIKAGLIGWKWVWSAREANRQDAGATCAVPPTGKT